MCYFWRIVDRKGNTRADKVVLIEKKKKEKKKERKKEREKKKERKKEREKNMRRRRAFNEI